MACVVLRASSAREWLHRYFDVLMTALNHDELRRLLDGTLMHTRMHVVACTHMHTGFLRSGDQAQSP